MSYHEPGTWRHSHARLSQNVLSHHPWFHISSPVTSSPIKSPHKENLVRRTWSIVLFVGMQLHVCTETFLVTPVYLSTLTDFCAILLSRQHTGFSHRFVQFEKVPIFLTLQPLLNHYICDTNLSHITFVWLWARLIHPCHFLGGSLISLWKCNWSCVVDFPHNFISLYGWRNGFTYHVLRYFLCMNTGVNLYVGLYEFLALIAMVVGKVDEEWYQSLHLSPTVRCVTLATWFQVTCLFF